MSTFYTNFWANIQTVLLDMDGTLLDLHFDNDFWNEQVPRHYAVRHGLSLAAAKQEVIARTRSVEGTLDWYCVDYWSRTLSLDIMALKQHTVDLIRVWPWVQDFLHGHRVAGRRVFLVTNAHPKTLALKMARTGLASAFDALVSSHDVGVAKEDAAFWPRLQAIIPFDPARSLLIDDSLSVLRAAKAYGMAHVVCVAQPDSTQPARVIAEFPVLGDVGAHV